MVSMRGVMPADLAARYPRLYHMAAEGSWPSIERHGLLSTSSLLDLFEVKDDERFALEQAHRPESVTISHPTHGTALVRDQKPMSDEGLIRSLQDGIRPREWYLILNRRVFFWATLERLRVMMNARAYRGLRKTIIVLDTARLLAQHKAAVALSPMNSGATKPAAHPRGRATFLPLNKYPFTERVSQRKEAVVEVTVEGGVAPIRPLVLRVEEVAGGRPPVVLIGTGLSEFG
jgi:hypothetical protein